MIYYKPDKFLRIWPVEFTTCPICGQPDDCNECNHLPLKNEEVVKLGGCFLSGAETKKYIIMK